MTVTMGIDIGTFEAKGALVDASTGRLLAQARRPHEMRVPRPGWAEHDAEADWWGAVTHLSQALLAQSGLGGRDVKALAVSAIGPCCLPVDRDGHPLRAGILYGVDTRAGAEIAELNARLGEERILSLAGTALNSQAVGPKILWIARQEPGNWARTVRLHTATSFVLERLTGAFAMDRYTAGSWAPLFDQTRGEWSDDLHGLCAPEQLPRLLWSAEIAGEVTAAAARATGLAPGTPVTTGTIDAAAEAVSVGVRRPGDTMVMMGSTVFVIQIARAPVRDPRLWAAPWLVPGRHAAMAGLATSGTLTQWLRGLLAPDLPREEAFAALSAEAEASPPGARGLVCLPYFSGERTPIHDPLARGVFFGLDLTHGRGDLMRAALEGIAAATRHIAETFAEAGSPVGRIMAVGGGTRNPVWLQATADMIGLPQELRRLTFGAAYGDAFLAARALDLAHEDDIDTWNPPVRQVAPHHRPVYDRHWAVFRQLYDRTADLMHETTRWANPSDQPGSSPGSASP
ncbi:FGGY-family carbohydrate kinase [Rubellimicrobium sp. CFH 75288]|uniref:FGGY-family carbohydrate kinase n=1 Tax=Rubellimicrobium sp. CFH 75288 TaxID=2697034 RepID=UPI001412262E|nr:FGGY family carbohydrate kinase [Rubellimicrobium sp. CFH 75288]NAZ35392.1 carbohydrate kinase [Rubellimicrobium sp. CFH 75288]